MHLRTLAVLLTVLVVTALARAQGPFEHAGPLATPVSSRHLMQYCGLLGLDGEQTAAAKELHKGYRAAYREATSRAHKNAETGDQSDPESRRMEVARRYVDEVRALEQQLLGDLKALCSEEQAAGFPRVERARRRAVGSRLSLAAGDGIDLVTLIERLKLPTSPDVVEVLLRWEQDIDRVELDRDRLVMDIFKMVSENPGANRDEAAIVEFLRGLHAVSVRARDFNRRALRELTPLYSPEAAAELSAEFNRGSFPRIYGDSDADRALTTAAGFEDLTAEQGQQVRSLAAVYAREAGPINDRWARAVEEKRSEFVSDPMHHEPPTDGNDPLVAAKTERLALDERTIEKLGRILNEDQRARLPKPSPPDDGRPEYLPDLGNEQMRQDWEEFENGG